VPWVEGTPHRPNRAYLYNTLILLHSTLNTIAHFPWIGWDRLHPTFLLDTRMTLKNLFWEEPHKEVTSAVQPEKLLEAFKHLVSFYEDDLCCLSFLKSFNTSSMYLSTHQPVSIRASPFNLSCRFISMF
jgi:hypothetical protein